MTTTNRAFALAVAASAVFAAASALGAPKSPGIELADCRLSSDEVKGSVEARCGWLEVPENPSEVAGKHIRIHVAVIPALRRQAQPDPLVILSGGPGQGASDFYLSIAGALEPIRRDRDLVLIDQRGTGKSNRLDCNFPDELANERFDAALVQRASKECVRKLAGDPRYYTTTVAVGDLESARIALGYTQVNLYGVSYGTRVAQHYLRRFPDRVRTIVLDGIVPVSAALGPDVAPAAQDAIDSILKRCAESQECSKAFPSVQSDFADLQTRLTRGAVPISILEPRSGRPTHLEFGYLHLAVAVRLLSYQSTTASVLPYLLHEAAAGRPQSLAAQAVMISKNMSKQIANGMHNAVVCTEDIPFIADPFDRAMLERTYLRDYFLSSLQAMCTQWPRGVIDKDFHDALNATVPALLLSGENDPVTPSKYGELAAVGFSNSKHLIVPGQGHGQITSLCVSRIVNKFISAGSSTGLDTECVAKQAAAPFMLDASSPGP